MSNRKTTYNGMPELQEFLIEIGFSLHQGFLDVGSTNNRCNWYACRITEQEAPLCTFSEKPVQTVIMPYSFNLYNGNHSEIVEVELRAQASDGEWWSMRCYEISAETIKTSLDPVRDKPRRSGRGGCQKCANKHCSFIVAE